jgi:hypothetical protein
VKFKKKGREIMLKFVAMLTMVLDHTGFVFFDRMTYENYILFHIVGRIAFPLFAYQVSISVMKTSSIKKYATRLLLWGIISQVPFYLLTHRGLPKVAPTNFFLYPFAFFYEIFKGTDNIMFTLLYGVLAIAAIKAFKKPDASFKSYGKNFLLALGLASIFILAKIMKTDYGIYGVLTIVLFYAFRNSKGVSLFAFFLLNFLFLVNTHLSNALSLSGIYSYNTFQIFSLMSLLFLKNHKPENDTPPRLKYLFYAFYPLHLIVLMVLKMFI